MLWRFIPLKRESATQPQRPCCRWSRCKFNRQYSRTSTPVYDNPPSQDFTHLDFDLRYQNTNLIISDHWAATSGRRKNISLNAMNSTLCSSSRLSSTTHIPRFLWARTGTSGVERVLGVRQMYLSLVRRSHVLTFPTEGSISVCKHFTAKTILESLRNRTLWAL